VLYGRLCGGYRSAFIARNSIERLYREDKRLRHAGQAWRFLRFASVSALEFTLVAVLVDHHR
jgi:hypothetical protein